ncbi:MAG: hypothetical protein RMH75_06715 [Archaeoglobaceae archaeon]|nr:hypothetical protein [Archaeoglobaceae archaeon]
MNEIEKICEKIVNSFPEANREEIMKKLKILIEEFRVPEKEALRCIFSQLSKEKGLKAVPRLVKINEIKEGYFDLKFKVLSVYEVKGQKIDRALLVGDETGTARIAVMKEIKASFTPGKCYFARNVYSKNGLLITKSTTISEINEEIKVKPLEFSGAIVAVGENSGIVLKCPSCSLPILGMVCKSHGKVKPFASYEAKITVDNGERVFNVTLKEKELEKISGLSKEEAINLRSTYTSNDPVYNELISRLIGRYVRLEISENVKVTPVEVVA